MREVKKSFFDFVFIYLSSIVAIPLMLVSEAIQGRYLGPENYGKLSLILSFISLLYYFGINWLNFSFIRFGKDEFDKKEAFPAVNSSFLFLNFILFFITACFYLTFEKWILNFFEVTPSPFYRYSILTGVLLYSLKNYVYQALKTCRLLKIQSIAERILPKIIICALVAGYYLLFREINILVIIIIYLFADFFIFIFGFGFLKKIYLRPFKLDRELTIRMLLFSLPLFFAAWANYVIDWIDTYAIKYFMSMEAVGVYNAAYKIFNSTKGVISSGIISVTVPIILVFNSRNESAKILAYFKRLVPQATLFGLIIFSVGIVIADPMIRLIYGNKFLLSITPFKILIASQSLGIINYMLTGILLARDETRFLSILGVALSVLNIIGDIILVPVIGINGAAIATSIMFALNGIIIHRYLSRKLQVKRLLPFYIGAVILPVLFINIYIPSYFLRVLITCIILVLTVLSGKRFNLFNPSDTELLNNISIPPRLRTFIEKIILFLS